LLHTTESKNHTALIGPHPESSSKVVSKGAVSSIAENEKAFILSRVHTFVSLVDCMPGNVGELIRGCEHLTSAQKDSVLLLALVPATRNRNLAKAVDKVVGHYPASVLLPFAREECRTPEDWSLLMGKVEEMVRKPDAAPEQSKAYLDLFAFAVKVLPPDKYLALIPDDLDITLLLPHIVANFRTSQAKAEGDRLINKLIEHEQLGGGSPLNLPCSEALEKACG